PGAVDRQRRGDDDLRLGERLRREHLTGGLGRAPGGTLGEVVTAGVPPPAAHQAGAEYREQDGDPACVEGTDQLSGVRLGGDRHVGGDAAGVAHRDRKSTRLNSSHVKISYAV